VLIRLISVSDDVVMAPNAKPITILRTIQEKSEVNSARATIRHPERNIPAKSVGLTPYNSIVLPTRGALSAIPINMAVAQNPINGVETSLPSRITDVMGIIIPQQNPTVNTALITVSSGEPCLLKFYLPKKQGDVMETAVGNERLCLFDHMAGNAAALADEYLQSANGRLTHCCFVPTKPHSFH
jgi:hypothetical protein